MLTKEFFQDLARLQFDWQNYTGVKLLRDANARQPRTGHFYASSACCGTAEMGGLYGVGFSIQDLEERIASAILMAIATNRGLLHYFQPEPEPLARHGTLAELEGAKIQKILERWGWRMSKTFLNPNTRRTLQHWELVLLPKRDYASNPEFNI